MFLLGVHFAFLKFKNIHSHFFFFAQLKYLKQKAVMNIITKGLSNQLNSEYRTFFSFKFIFFRLKSK